MTLHSLMCLLMTLAFVSQHALGASAPFALYGTVFLEELIDSGHSGKINLRFQPGPFTWTPASSLGPLDGWDVNAHGLYFLFRGRRRSGHAMKPLVSFHSPSLRPQLLTGETP